MEAFAVIEAVVLGQIIPVRMARYDTYAISQRLNDVLIFFRTFPGFSSITFLSCYCSVASNMIFVNYVSFLKNNNTFFSQMDRIPRVATCRS